MPWLKVSDQAAMHPIVIAPLADEDADDALVNELFGWVHRCAVQAAAYETDYVIDMATARAMAGSAARFKYLRDHAIKAGYMTRSEMQDGEGSTVPALRLVEEKDLFHMLRKSERAWETQRRRDTNDRDLTVPVRLRDGDQCRYCPKIVNWNDRKSARSATIDHVHGRPAESPDDLVVACRSCNGKKKDVSAEDADMKLRAAPAEPFYSPITVEFLAKDGVHVTPSTVPGGDDVATAGRSSGDPGEGDLAAEGSPQTVPGDTETATAGRVRDDHDADGERVASVGSVGGDPGSGNASAEGSPSRVPGSASAVAESRSVPGGDDVVSVGSVGGDPGEVDLATEGSPQRVPGGIVAVSEGSDGERGESVAGGECPDGRESNADLVEIWSGSRSAPDIEAERSGYAGSGRDGSGRGGSGSAGEGREVSGRVGRLPVRARRKRKR